MHIEVRNFPHQLDLTIPELEGFRRFIGAWVLDTSHGVVVVDPGPFATIPILIHELESRGIEKLAAILLTHIHVDHAGGTAALLKKFSHTPVVAHSRVHKHLADPAELTRGSVKVLGESLMGIYGPIHPVLSELLVAAETSQWGAILTPGHSSDHVCYAIGDTIFIGEAMGNTTPDTPQFYLRPATPPRFFFDIYTSSIRAIAMKVAEQKTVRYCFGHFGMREEHAGLVPRLPEIALAQIGLWVDIVRKNAREAHSIIVERLLEADTNFAPFKLLPTDIQSREQIFVSNSIRGILSSDNH